MSTDDITDDGILCRTCEIQKKMDRGEFVTQNDLNHWALWGCTCDSEDLDDALAYFNSITD